MGWNSWNCWGKEVREENIKDAARAMAESGLIHHGWSYICIDDAWEGQRDRETLRLGSNEKFPDMKALGDFIHSLGLKFGIYTDVGYMTCQGLMGSRGYDFLDADTFARWGVDYVKADWCYAHGMNAEASYKTLGLAIRQTGRDMVFSVCTAGYSIPWKWAESVGGNLWPPGRTFGITGIRSTRGSRKSITPFTIMPSPGIGTIPICSSLAKSAGVSPCAIAN
jgi:alpha-galactosidase